jgi:hypothetical protein
LNGGLSKARDGRRRPEFLRGPRQLNEESEDVGPKNVVKIRSHYITGIPADFRSKLLASDFVICKEQTTSIKRGRKPYYGVIELLEKSTGNETL